jgi:dolichol-phosphate mannosyltransferase
VEDNSPDGTKQIAHDLVGVYKELNIVSDGPMQRVLERRGKLGLGSAYRDGLKLCKGEFVIIMDADLSHHPKYIPIMIEYFLPHLDDRFRPTRTLLQAVGTEKTEELRAGASTGS